MTISSIANRITPWLGIFCLALCAACAAPRVTQGQITVEVAVDGLSEEVDVPAGSTVQNALQAAGVELDALDRSEPPQYSLLSDGALVRVVRVAEEFLVEEVVIPFEQQILQNESLPEGERRLVQPGVNGLQETTSRRVLEDGVEVSVSPVKSVIVQEPLPEIVMVGSQSPFAAIPIPGRLAYLSAGNAWVMEGTTGNRRPVVTTGDLDGRVFKLSPDGEFLLFSRNEADEETINSLWVAVLGNEFGPLIDLEVQNVVHFADWSPQTQQTVAYSTVEPRDAPPGWQANNDLNIVTFSVNGWIARRSQPLESNSGGIYGWWGSSFAWSPDGRRLAYTRPDGIGMVDLREEEPFRLLDITPLQTNSDWAWVPGLAWGPDGAVLFTVDHAPSQGVVSEEESPLFDLTAIPLLGGPVIPLVEEVGMFAYPRPSPLVDPDSEDQEYQVAYLQSIFPTQSRSSRYHLVVMDRDGSNRQVLFPPEGAPGLDPQEVVWSPEALFLAAEAGTGAQNEALAIAINYQGNLWLVDPLSGGSWQLTGDGLINRLDWR